MPRQSTALRDNQVFNECKRHSDQGFNETDQRATGRNRIGTISFNEADELFRSWLDENNWPYDALMFDPRIFTFIFEKTSRLLAKKLKGKLIPREGNDVLSAEINNQILSYQWDKANHGGTMLGKWQIMDLNTRKYGAAFALCKWRYECDSEGKVMFDGPEMQVLKNRDCAHDMSADSIESCNWFQVREYVTMDSLEMVNDEAHTKPIYKNLDRLRAVVSSESPTDGGDNRGTNWISRNRAISGLEQDPVGKDAAFPVVEIVTEYRRDRWITFAPKHGVVIRDIPNPYKNYELPIIMLRYYPIDDDLYGLSEIEPVKSLQKAINALLSQYLDEVNQRLFSPVAVGPGVRQHTLEWGKGARWIMNNPMTDFRVVESNSQAAQFFQSTYSVLVAAMQNALGESSLGVSNVQPFQQDKTATEVKALTQQRNARDNNNQNFLAEAIERQMMLWHSMNQLLLFADPKKASYILRITGKDAIDFFQQAGMGGYTVDDEMAKDALNIIEAANKIGETITPQDFLTKPRYSVNLGSEKEPRIVPKLQLDNYGHGATLHVQPEDLQGTFDYSADVEAMAVDSDANEKSGRQTAVTLLTSNPNVTAMLAAEGVKPKFKELFTTWLEDLGFADAQKYFESSVGGGATPPPPSGGVPSIAGMGGGAPAPAPAPSPAGQQPGQFPSPIGGIPSNG